MTFNMGARVRDKRFSARFVGTVVSQNGERCIVEWDHWGLDEVPSIWLKLDG